VALLPGRQNPIPFSARCIARQDRFTAEEGETVEVHRMAPEDACSTEMLVLIAARSGHGRSTVPTRAS